jgi:hypothetical protein
MHTEAPSFRLQYLAIGQILLFLYLLYIVTFPIPVYIFPLSSP